MEKLEQLARQVRRSVLVSTTEAGSGHPTSCLSAADLLTVLMFGGYFKADLERPDYKANDRLVFSKGHSAPLLYSLYAAAGKVSQEELKTLRKFGSRLEGHPTYAFPYTEVPTGSLGQGLSVGAGMALAAKADNLPYRTYVLLGDSEMAEGSVWESMQVAAYYHLDNLIAILDVNRLGQRGQTMAGWDTESYRTKAEAFGWEAYVVDGHNLAEIQNAYDSVAAGGGPGRLKAGKPKIIIAKTVKGKGVSFLEDQDGWHGKALDRDGLKKALSELGEGEAGLVGQVLLPGHADGAGAEEVGEGAAAFTSYQPGKAVATRKAYGNILASLVAADSRIVVLDAETGNSTYAELAKAARPDRFYECFIAEQNMVGMAMGLARRGKVPFVSTFAAFLTRAFDQARMAALGGLNIKFVGSHAGVSIGQDGASQMGLEEIAMFRSLPDSVVLYPSDAVSAERLIALAAGHNGLVYIQTTRQETPVIYRENHSFRIGGSGVIKSSQKDSVAVVGAGITVHEAMAAYEDLVKEGIFIRVIDLYSLKPLDLEVLGAAARETGGIITVEDGRHEGGLAEAVLYGVVVLLGLPAKFKSLSVKKPPKSGSPEELMAYEEINKQAIVGAVKDFLKS